MSYDLRYFKLCILFDQNIFVKNIKGLQRNLSLRGILNSYVKICYNYVHKLHNVTTPKILFNRNIHF